MSVHLALASANATVPATLFHYEGELGVDLWALGRWWGDLVARRWEAAVRGSVTEITRVAESAARHRREQA